MQWPTRGDDTSPPARLDLGALSPTTPPAVQADLQLWLAWTRQPIVKFGFDLLATEGRN